MSNDNLTQDQETVAVRNYLTGLYDCDHECGYEPPDDGEGRGHCYECGRVQPPRRLQGTTQFPTIDGYEVEETLYTQSDIEHTNKQGITHGIVLGFLYGMMFSCALAIAILYAQIQ